MEVKLLHYTPLWVCSSAIRKCWASEDKSDTKEYQIDVAIDNVEDFYLQRTKVTGSKDKALIDRVGNKNKHSSTLEHLYYNFDIQGISRALLQELVRHRISSFSVKSTRYTLKELKDELPFISHKPMKNWLIVNGLDGSKVWHDIGRARKYIVLLEDDDINASNIQALENVRYFVSSKSNDISKYALPEAFKTSLAWSINARSLQNFLRLRTSKQALWEIRDLAYKIFQTLPEEHKYLFVDCVSKHEIL